MSTATMNISLPTSLKEYVKERVDEERYSTPSDYIRALIREERKRRDEKKLEQMLLEGINSGPGVEFGTKEWDAFWESIHTRIRDEASKKTIHV
jgi:antitoxin ParD1/3/4